MKPPASEEPNRHGRTSWWPCDAAEHDRELVVELGEEFGPIGPYVMRVLKDLAQQQRSATVRSGFRVMRTKTFANDTEQVRTVIEFAARIGALDDLAIDEDGRRFTCRISGWESDNERGRAAWRKQDQRERESRSDVTKPELSRSGVTNGEKSRSVPHTRPNQTIENSGDTSAAVVARAAAPSAFDDVMAVVTEAGITSPDLDMTVMRVLDAYPHANHRRAVNLAVNDMRSGRRTTPHFYQAFSDRCKDQEAEAPKLSEKEQRAAADLAALERLMQRSSDAVA